MIQYFGYNISLSSPPPTLPWLSLSLSLSLSLCVCVCVYIQVQADLCALFPPAQWNDLHLQMIYFGREYCTAKQHEVGG